MKRFLIIFMLLVLVSTSCFAKTKHHHRGDHIYTGNVSVSNEKVAKASKLNAEVLGYESDTYLVYRSYLKEFEYSVCHHIRNDIDHNEVIRIANKQEIRNHHLRYIIPIIGIILIFIIGIILQLDMPSKSYHRISSF